MTDPTTLLECPVCKGYGYLHYGCPYPEDTEVKCEDCSHGCGDDLCDACDGIGEVDAITYNLIVNQLSISDNI